MAQHQLSSDNCYYWCAQSARVRQLTRSSRLARMKRGLNDCNLTNSSSEQERNSSPIVVEKMKKITISLSPIPEDKPAVQKRRKSRRKIPRRDFGYYDLFSAPSIALNRNAYVQRKITIQ